MNSNTPGASSKTGGLIATMSNLLLMSAREQIIAAVLLTAAVAGSFFGPNVRELSDAVMLIHAVIVTTVVGYVVVNGIAAVWRGALYMPASVLFPLLLLWHAANACRWGASSLDAAVSLIVEHATLCAVLGIAMVFCSFALQAGRRLCDPPKPIRYD